MWTMDGPTCSRIYPRRLSLMAGSTKGPVGKLARVEKHVTPVVRSVKTQGMENEINETRKTICRHAGASINWVSLYIPVITSSYTGSLRLTVTVE